MKAVLMFLIDQFPDLLDLNLTVSIVILFILCVRQFLKRAPKIFSYALWGIVLLRLLVPVSIESPMSFVPERTEFSSMVEVNEVLPEIQFETPRDRADNEWHAENTPSGEPLVQTYHTADAQTYLTLIWLAGMAGMAVYSAVSYMKLRRKLRTAIPFRKRILIADHINSPFVMGLFRPVIYLPGTLSDTERRYIIAHERHHIRRGDHVFKALGFLALTIHWFNPLVWLAFSLANRDMEMSCDEAVIRKLGTDVRAAYSETLLNLATGQRLFSVTPLAFGEGNPAGRVRNLAKWKKPAVWTIVACAVLCVALAACLLTDPMQRRNELTDAPEAEQTNSWGISIVPEYVSSTGAAAVFACSEDITELELTFGDDLSLDRYENSAWKPVEELPGFTYYVGDSSYPVVTGYGMVHEWPNRFGELPDGTYRMGKLVTLHHADGSIEEQMVYGYFTLPNDIQTGLIPLEDLPKKYSAEQAMIDGCFVQADGTARENKELFHQFVASSLSGQPAMIRIVNWYYGDDAYCEVYDLEYDGTLYTISWIADGQRHFRQFPYLRHFTAVTGEENIACDHYVLVHDDQITWNVWGDLIGSHAATYMDHMTVYSDYTYPTKKPQLPSNLRKVALEFEGVEVVSTTDFDRLEKIWLLFSNAEFLGFEPKTHSVGVGLNLILYTQSGETVTIELDPDDDLCRIQEEFVFYGAPDEPSYIEKLWYYLDIERWPDEVYDCCPNAYRIQSVG